MTRVVGTYSAIGVGPKEYPTGHVFSLLFPPSAIVSGNREMEYSNLIMSVHFHFNAAGI